MTLFALQSAMQQRVLDGACAIDPFVAGDAQSVAARLAIYEQAYRARLKEALAVAYPVLKKLLGPQSFDASAAAYIAAKPSIHRSIRWYGAGFDCGFHGMQADLARWEWLLAEVFDAADDTSMAAEDLARVAPAAWPDLRLRLHRTLRFYTATTNAVACWKAAGAGEPPLRPLDIDTPTSWIVWRRDLTIRFRSMAPDEARALALLSSGESFGALCAALAVDSDALGAAVRAATLLKGWIHEGLIGRASRGASCDQNASPTLT